MRLTVIIAVLDSHEAVRRQMLHFAKFLPDDCELLIVDDGSSPPLRPVFDSLECSHQINWRMIATNDFRPWTQPCARNTGASSARGDMLLFLDVDHIIGRATLRECLSFAGDRMDWPRIPAGLSESGELIPADGEQRKPAGGCFLMRVDVFRNLRGFNERFCGEYGYDDSDILNRFNAAGFVNVTSETPGYYWCGDVPAMHSLDHAVSSRNANLLGAR